MTKILVASLLVSTLSLPVAASASTATGDLTPLAPVRVSTGVIAPVVLSTPVLNIADSAVASQILDNAQVKLSLTVNPKGRAENIHVVKSYNSYLDQRVIDTVSRLHFRPGSIDNQPIAVNMDLTVNVAH